MKRVFVILLLFILVVAGALYFYASRKPTPTAASLLPDTTLLFLDAPNFPRANTAFRQTPVFELWQEPSVQTFLADPLRNLNTLLGRPADTPGNIGDEILPLLQGEAFIALTHFAGKESFQSGLVLGADLKYKLIETKAALAYKELSIKTWIPTATITTKNHLGTKYSIWELSPKLQVCHAFFGSMIVITFNEDILRDIIARASSTAAEDLPSLAQSAAYKTTLRHIPATRHVIAYFNAGQLLGPLFAFSRQRTGPLGGFARIESTSTSMTFTPGLVEDFGFTVYATPETNHLRRLTGQTRAFTTPQTSAYIATTADFPALHRTLLDLTGQLDQTPTGKATTRFEQALTALGINLDQDVLPAFGPDTALLATWREGARLPDLALVTECRDTPALREKMDIVFAALKDTAFGSDEEFPWENTTELGTRLRTARIGSGVIAPTYFIDAHHFILALTPDYARELLTQSRAPGTNNLPTTLTSRLPTNNTEFSYCDLRAVFPPLYALWRDNITNDLISVDQLPPGNIIAKHLGRFVSATQTTPTNETTITYSALGKPATWLLGAAGTFVWAQPWLANHVSFVNPNAPKTSSSTASPPPPPGNQKATSQTPSPR